MALLSRFSLFLLLAASLLIACTDKKIEILSVPAGNMPAVIRADGSAVLPSGRFLTPAGELIRITHDPFGMAVSPDGKKTVTLHDGVFTIIDLKSLNTIRVPSYDKKIKSPLSENNRKPHRANSYIGFVQK